jgi:hypothetical protein
VRARIAGVGNQRLDLAVLDVERAQSRNPKSKTRRALPPGGLSVNEDSGGVVTAPGGGNRGR